MAFHDLLFAAQIPASLDAFDARSGGGVRSARDAAPVDDGFSRLAAHFVRFQARARRAVRSRLRILRIGY